MGREQPEISPRGRRDGRDNRCGAGSPPENEIEKESLRARNRIVWYLARRDHSEKELRQKLGRAFQPEAVEAAIAWARARQYIKEGAVLAEQVVRQLLQRKKSSQYIARYLKQKGLPAVSIDAQVERENAKAYLLKRFGRRLEWTFPLKQKAMAALQTRGFHFSVIQGLFSEAENDDDF